MLRSSWHPFRLRMERIVLLCPFEASRVSFNVLTASSLSRSIGLQTCSRSRNRAEAPRNKFQGPSYLRCQKVNTQLSSVEAIPPQLAPGCRGGGCVMGCVGEADRRPRTEADRRPPTHLIQAYLFCPLPDLAWVPHGPSHL